MPLQTIVSELETLAEARRTNLALAAANKDLREQLDRWVARGFCVWVPQIHGVGT
jgi:hypothetical protein